MDRADLYQRRTVRSSLYLLLADQINCVCAASRLLCVLLPTRVSIHTSYVLYVHIINHHLLAQSFHSECPNSFLDLKYF
jgi:hypothetical protein